MSVAENLKRLQARIPAGVQLVAVSKTHPASIIQEAYDAGHRDFGENRVQELLQKQAALPKDISWHLIGHLQRNKVKQIVPFVRLIHSVDSERLLTTIDREAQSIGRVVDCLLQVHIAEEKTKYGFTFEEVRALLQGGAQQHFANARIVGLMGMATLTDNQMQIAEEFVQLRTLFDTCRQEGWVDPEIFREVSMGMSNDYHLAVKAESTIIRVGSAIFGARQMR